MISNQSMACIYQGLEEYFNGWRDEEMAEGCGTTTLLQLATGTQVGEARAGLPVQATALQHCEEQIILECCVGYFFSLYRCSHAASSLIDVCSRSLNHSCRRSELSTIMAKNRPSSNLVRSATHPGQPCHGHDISASTEVRYCIKCT